MDRAEFKQWADDLVQRLPDTGEYVANLEPSTRDKWFDEIFSDFDLRDALAMNFRLMHEAPKELSRFERDRLPGLFARVLQEVRHKRRNREASIRQRQHLGAMKSVTTHAEMGPAYRYTVQKIREWKQSHDGQMPEQYQIHRWVEEIYAQLERAAS